MADEYPGVGEEMLHLQIEDLGIHIDIPVHLGRPDQRSDSGGIIGITAHAGGSRGSRADAEYGWRASKASTKASGSGTHENEPQRSLGLGRIKIGVGVLKAKPDSPGSRAAEFGLSLSVPERGHLNLDGFA